MRLSRYKSFHFDLLKFALQHATSDIMVATERLAKSTSNASAAKSPELLSRERREVRKLGTLLEISRLLADTSNLKTAFAATLETLGRHHGIFRGFVMLRDSESDKIRIEASYGLNQDSTHRVTYRVGEGVIGRVVQSGKPVVVPQTSREPLLLNRLRSH